MKPRIWLHLLKRSLMENFIFCALSEACYLSRYMIIKHMKEKFRQAKMMFVIMPIQYNTAQKMRFSIKISSVNLTKSAVSCGFGHMYLRNP